MKGIILQWSLFFKAVLNSGSSKLAKPLGSKYCKRNCSFRTASLNEESCWRAELQGVEEPALRPRLLNRCNSLAR
jgi:hypothetical protein